MNEFGFIQRLLSRMTARERIAALEANALALKGAPLQTGARSGLISRLLERYQLQLDPRAPLYCTLALVVPLLVGLLATLQFESLRGKVLCSLMAVYLSFVSLVLFLRARRNWHVQRVLFSLPLVLEQLLLLVQSGLDLLPSITELAQSNSPTPSHALLGRVVTKVDTGSTLSEAIRDTADRASHELERHVLYHLEMALQEGSSLGTALRSLAEHAHVTWKQSVETRIRRLENLVVFPVFVGVIGLLFLSASVPLVPLLELRSSLRGASSAGPKPGEASRSRPSSPLVVRGAP